MASPRVTRNQKLEQEVERRSRDKTRLDNMRRDSELRWGDFFSPLGKMEYDDRTKMYQRSGEELFYFGEPTEARLIKKRMIKRSAILGARNGALLAAGTIGVYYLFIR